MLFIKAIEKKVKIHFPKDVISATLTDIELAKQEQTEYEHQVHQQQIAISQLTGSKGKKTGGSSTVGADSL